MAVALPICMGPGNNNDRSYEHYGVDHGEVFGVIIGMLLIGILFFSTGLFSSGYADYKVFVKPAFAIGCISALAALYMCSFRGFTEDMVEDIGVFFVAKSPAKFAGLAVLTASLVILCFGIKNFFGNRTVKVFTGLVFASAVIPLIGVYSGYITSTVMANIMLLLYAAIFVWSAYIEEDRRLFWAGILTVSVMIVSRTLEYETGLHIKAAAFTACGIGVMAAGVIFERYLKSRRLCDE